MGKTGGDVEGGSSETMWTVARKIEEGSIDLSGRRSARVIVRDCLAASPRPAGYREDIFAQEMGSSIVCTFVQTVQLRGCAGPAVLSVWFSKVKLYCSVCRCGVYRPVCCFRSSKAKESREHFQGNWRLWHCVVNVFDESAIFHGRVLRNIRIHCLRKTSWESEDSEF